MRLCSVTYFFFTDTATTEIYTLSLHDALPISRDGVALQSAVEQTRLVLVGKIHRAIDGTTPRSEEHTSELQSHVNLVCRLLLEKKKQNNTDDDKQDYKTKPYSQISFTRQNCHA